MASGGPEWNVNVFNRTRATSGAAADEAVGTAAVVAADDDDRLDSTRNDIMEVAVNDGVKNNTDSDFDTAPSIMGPAR